jgi:transposase
MSGDTTTISIDEWRLELERLAGEARNVEGFTTGELAEMWGVSSATVRNRLRLAKKNGYLIPCRVMRENITGAMQGYPGYRFKVPAES